MTAAVSPTGRFAPYGRCGRRGCDQPATYECRFADWPDGMRSGACDEHAPELRRSPQLIRLCTWKDPR